MNPIDTSPFRQALAIPFADRPGEHSKEQGHDQAAEQATRLGGSACQAGAGFEAGRNVLRQRLPRPGRSTTRT
ncbi:MAG: hypothetical protein JWM11_2351 [Planctomycetaceae bacterium]|nr:hypothetical protein [Planctomycetaceae bacterium]